MALRRTLLLGLVTAIGLMFFYILCVNLEGPPTWSTVPLKNFQFFSLGVTSDSRGAEEPLLRDGDRLTYPPPSSNSNLTDQHENTRAERIPTPLNTEHKQAETNALEVPKSSSDDGSDKTRTRISTKAPAVKLQQPTEAVRSKEPPHIGDTYMSDDIPPQTDCPDGIRSHVSDTVFGARFLKNIPVLQRVKHATSEQHQRLSHYPGAHGWSNIDHMTLLETLAALNSSANWGMFDDWRDRSDKSECIRCAVVGNGGILKDSKKGEEIDSHHYVFRTNGAITKGFEQDVGTRTTHYTFSTNTLMNSFRSYKGLGYKGPPQSKETRYVFLPDHDRDYLMVKAAATHTLVERGKEQGKDPTQYFGKDVSAEKLKLYHPDFIRYIRNRFLHSKTLDGRYKNLYRPSTGAVMLLAALHTCDKVSAYGFITPDFRKYSCHYYDRVFSPLVFYANHDLKLEMILWQQLHQAGLIKLYMHE
ncbi:alpha-N-acetylgalactosaminide alpha-2,6-sialyltransferase 2-like [Cheilinus undulatus]|uniref:alpha-N-acetylgalactosaminide alpha-2,6-sialyltransferase 2-like n=1 Tax=Cheilinus undulatus TaxID=241271 RepID=UPI001BD4943A|nr:alpha-N-acetylgalactosaminide alpha-2,6-sialyltransferase 2-like [Cheilinus undulatus]XP_041671774.1 alpha-N-acetylgalactosaminide alpha-2,6-sialyltransferase 2-like [Cheilinus undulatus]XP_041671775.1 alpha-N-acetylgalactosaminide alpha-2,6-sialyltransferase 2-like [Cheilinus undulatus]